MIDAPAAQNESGRLARSLTRTAIALLSRRDFGRAELKARLLKRLEDEAGEPRARELLIDQVLDRLQAQGYLSEERFVKEFVRARAARFGPVRLRHELLRRGVDEERIESTLKGAGQDEFAVAQALWRKRFKVPPADARERARQSRFLAARGFSHEVIRRVLVAPVPHGAQESGGGEGD